MDKNFESLYENKMKSTLLIEKEVKEELNFDNGQIKTLVNI
jgi:hypothetical protein